MNNCKDCNLSEYGCVCQRVEDFFNKCKDLPKVNYDQDLIENSFFYFCGEVLEV